VVGKVSGNVILDQFSQDLGNLKEVRDGTEEAYAYCSKRRIAARIDMHVASGRSPFFGTVVRSSQGDGKEYPALRLGAVGSAIPMNVYKVGLLRRSSIKY
jgi:hypothetical protein